MSHTGGLHYKVNETPPWYSTIILAFQQCLVTLTGTLFMPILIGSIICAKSHPFVMSELLGNIFIASGLATIIQDVFGTRLPIIQCASFAFIAPILSLAKTDDWKCTAGNTGMTIQYTGNADNGTVTANNNNSLTSMDEITSRMQMLSGTIMVVAVIEIIIGLTGLVGFLLHFIGPLTVAPTIMLLALSLTDAAAMQAGNHWGISIGTIVLIIILSECLPVCSISLPNKNRRTIEDPKTSVYFHKLFSVIISICCMWLVCYALTVTDTLPNDPTKHGYLARTDIRIKALQDAHWFRMSYPGKWGMPSFNVPMFVGLLVGVFMSIIESVGDYYACGRISGAPTPPHHAVNRGIMIEGFGCIIAGALCAGSGVTSSSENIGAISLTKVGSRRVGQVAGIVLILFGCFGKFSALLVTIPDPIIGGSFIMMFAIIAAVGASNLQYADMNSSRNILVFGLALFLGLAVPKWTTDNADQLKTGNDNLDNVASVLMGTSMLVGCFVALILDNILPGTQKERGISSWKAGVHHDYLSDSEKHRIISQQRSAYGLPFCGNFMSRLNWIKYVPICPEPSRVGAGRSSSSRASGGDAIQMSDVSNHTLIREK